MGTRIRRPMAFQGMTRKEAKVHKVLKIYFVMKGEDLDEQWNHWNNSFDTYLGNIEHKTGTYHEARGTVISFVKNITSTSQDNNEGFAITHDMRQNQAKVGNRGAEAIREQEMVVEHMGNDINIERTKRWRAWVEKSWDTKEEDIDRWIRGKKRQGQLIVLPGGSARMSDILK
eukprot:9610308-Heterocapsa_arctica.AAC.1